MRWFFIPARNPDVGVSIPALVTGMPGPVAMLRRRRRDYLTIVPRRPNADHELRGCGSCCAGGKQGSKGKCQEFTIHFLDFLSYHDLLLKNSKPHRAKKSPCPTY
jgi:hypothetical protein